LAPTVLGLEQLALDLVRPREAQGFDLGGLLGEVGGQRFDVGALLRQLRLELDGLLRKRPLLGPNNITIHLYYITCRIKMCP
jgi:hypothetical protein